MNQPEIDTRFDYHRPNEATAKKHEEAREVFKTAAQWVSDNLPENRETALAFTKLEEAMFWTNACIARRGFIA